MSYGIFCRNVYYYWNNLDSIFFNYLWDSSSFNDDISYVRYLELKRNRKKITLKQQNILEMYRKFIDSRTKVGWFWYHIQILWTDKFSVTIRLNIKSTYKFHCYEMHVKVDGNQCESHEDLIKNQATYPSIIDRMCFSCGLFIFNRVIVSTLQRYTIVQNNLYVNIICT